MRWTALVVVALAVAAVNAWAGAAAGVARGSLAIAGFDDRSGAVWVDAVRVPYDAASGSFLARELSAGTHEVRVEKDQRVAYKGVLEVRGDQNHRCLLEARGREWALDCFFERPAQACGVSSPAPAPAPAPAPVEASGPAVLEWVLKDPMDMCNIYVDGTRVAEFRTGDRKRTVQVAPGTHTIEIRDFTEFETWHRGTLVVGPGQTLSIGFAEEGSVEVYNQPGAWQGQ